MSWEGRSLRGSEGLGGDSRVAEGVWGPLRTSNGLGERITGGVTLWVWRGHWGDVTVWGSHCVGIMGWGDFQGWIMEMGEVSLAGEGVALV